MLAAKPVIGDRPSAWLSIWQGKTRAMTTLARMLALSPAGRVPSATPKEPEEVSYYTRMALEAKAKRDDDPAN